MSNDEGLILETALSVAALAILIWVLRILLPAAARQDDRFAQLCALLTLALALFLWIMFGAPRVY